MAADGCKPCRKAKERLRNARPAGAPRLPPASGARLFTVVWVDGSRPPVRDLTSMEASHTTTKAAQRGERTTIVAQADP